jgi:hypothetical protein
MRTDARAGLVQHGVEAFGKQHDRRQLLLGAASGGGFKGGALMGDLFQDRGAVVRDRHQYFEAVVIGPASAERLVDGDDREHLAGGVAQRQKERVGGVPCVRRGMGTGGRGPHRHGLTPLERAGRKPHSAAAFVLGLEHRFPLAPRAAGVEQRIARVLVAEHHDRPHAVVVAVAEIPTTVVKRNSERITCANASSTATAPSPARAARDTARRLRRRRMPGSADTCSNELARGRSATSASAATTRSRPSRLAA